MNVTALLVSFFVTADVDDMNSYVLLVGQCCIRSVPFL